MRLFIAIQLDDTIKNALTGMQAMTDGSRSRRCSGAALALPGKTGQFGNPRDRSDTEMTFLDCVSVPL